MDARYGAEMRPLLRRVPQLNRLAVFDAVARAGDFTSAARELEISQPAVSRHMAALARELGLELFERHGRTLSLTPQGRTLADATDGSFAVLERALADLDDPAIVFAVQPAMATTWIVPLLDQLEAAAQTEIRLRIFDRRAELDDREWDLAIVPGTGDWADWTSTLLFGEAVRPFASPALARELGFDALTRPSSLIGANLLHIDEVGRPNMTWAEWFGETGEPATLPQPRLKYNAYPTVIQEALAGNGIALGWQHLLSDLVERGLLVPVGPVVQRRNGGHHFCWRSDRDDRRYHDILECVRDEILGSSESFPAV